nr:DUF2442 domain-containing protein [Clostridia bacterium]
MLVRGDIVYGDGTLLKITEVTALGDYRLFVRFGTGEVMTVDLFGLLEYPAFSPLKDKKIFDSVYLKSGIPTWCDGDIDIAPEYLHRNGISISGDDVL